ncbi:MULTISPECIES: response regulator [Glycomyces]|uniref:DNA-binding NarL/FixJ family response regulator n=1 Tax=Glycomyces lechevalierae TaxID=256034 RepID=A0A9X3PMS7_9ACTN|nr:response regulator transcription factor [Glycomyces lechevalierae]MDA1388359.1 response regulator transcription factor [Glycomyces lechevalierae]MDR7338433.1 DNA-binding NarL/FixJ family response regulator [Glycomyces lechevalierae]
MTRVVIADDEPLVVEGVRTVLHAAGIETVAMAHNGSDALTAIERHRPEVALLDLHMPGLGGLAVAERLPAVSPATRALVLTSFGDQANVLSAVEKGAAGFVLKTCAPEELVTAVRAVAAGEAYLSPVVTRMVLGLVAPESAPRRRDAVERVARLAAREREVLDAVAEGLSNAEIAGRVHMSEATVKTYVSRVLAKLGCANRVQAAMLARDARS